ncbi:MAG: anthranilate/aminodeoxychorismate synthase component II, partial [Phycisphaerae bacterium]
MILIVDNYDSFTYNLVQTIGGLDAQREMKVVRNDAASAGELVALRPTHVIVSPGPCTPNEAGVSVELIRRLAGT